MLSYVKGKVKQNHVILHVKISTVFYILPQFCLKVIQGEIAVL